MKKLFLALVLAGCFAVFAVPAQAAVVSRTTFHSDFTFFDACTNELVHIVGDLEVLATSTVNDNHVSGTLHTVFLATGTGLESGLTYHEEVVFNRAFSSSLENGQATVTTFGEIHVVAPGGGNNLWSPFLVHTTFDAEGNLVSSILNPLPTPGCH